MAIGSAIFGESGNLSSITKELYNEVPSIISLVGTLRFNLDFHPHHGALNEGSLDGACRSLDRDHWVGWILGENDHEDHHRAARRAKRPCLDLPYHLFLRPLAFCGLIWDLEVGPNDGKRVVDRPRAA